MLNKTLDDKAKVQLVCMFNYQRQKAEKLATELFIYKRRSQKLIIFLMFVIVLLVGVLGYVCIK